MVFLISLFATSSLALAQFVELPVDQEFDLRRRVQDERVRDFYLRMEELNRKDELRRKDEQDQKKLRSEYKLERESSRIAHIKERKTKPSVQLNAHMAEIMDSYKRRENDRKAYLLRRKALRAKLRQLQEIPAEEELDIDIKYEDSINESQSRGE